MGKNFHPKREISTIKENEREEDLMWGKDPTHKREEEEDRPSNFPSM